MPRPSDWNVLGLHGDPTPGDPVQIRLLVDDLVKIGTQARSIAQAIDQVMNTADSSVFAGKTADALRGKVDERLRNHIHDVADSFWEVSQNLSAWANHIEDAQRQADGALSAARGLAKDDPQVEAHRQTAQNAGTHLADVGNTTANAIRNASDIRLPISDCQVFWEMFQILAIILIVPALIFGGPVALLALGVNMTLFVKAAIDFARGDIGFLDLFLAGLGIIAPTTKALPIFAIGGLLKSGFKAVLQWGRNGFLSLKDLVNGFRFATVFTGLRDVARISLTWVREGGLWVMQNFHNVPALAGSVFVKGGLVVVQGVRAVPVVVRGWGSAVRAGAPGAWQNFRIFAQETWSSQMAGGKWTRLILPVTHTDVAEYGLKGALRMGFWDRGVMGRGVWDLPVGGTIAHTASAVPMGPHGATPHLDLGHANINMARMDLENVRFGNFADTHTSVRPSSFSVAPVSTVDLTGLRVGTVNPVAVHGANAVFDNSTAGFRAVRHMDDVVDIAGTQMSRMRIDAMDAAPGQMSGGLGVSAAAPGGHVTHSSGLYVPGSAGTPVVHEGVDVAALVAKGNGGNLLAQGPTGVLTAPPGGTGAMHTALTGVPAPAPGATGLHDLLAAPGAPGAGTGAAHTALTGVPAPPSGAGVHDLLAAPGGTGGAHGPLTGVPGHQSGTGAAGGSAFDLLSGGAKGTPNNPVPAHIGSDLGDNVAGAARANQAHMALDEIVRPAGSGRPGSVATDAVPGSTPHGVPAPGLPKGGVHGTPPKDAARSALDLLDDGRGVRPVDGPAFAGAPGTGKAVDADTGHAFAGAPARGTDDVVTTPGTHGKAPVTGDGHVAVPLRQDPAPAPATGSGGGRVHSHEAELFHEVNLKLGKMGSGAVTVEAVTAARQVLEDLRGAAFTKVDIRAQADQLAVHLAGTERGHLPGGVRDTDLTHDAPTSPGPGGHHAPPAPPRPPRPESGLLDGLDDVDLDATGAPLGSRFDFDDDSVPGTPVSEHGTEDLDGFSEFVDLIRPLRQHVERAIENPAANIEVALVASPGGRTWREFSDDVGHAMVAVMLPGERKPLTIGFYPEEGHLFGNPGAIVNDAEYLVSGHVRVLGTYRITAAQLFDGYRYAMANSGAVYDLFRYNCVRFAEGFVSAALGKSVADLWVAAPYRLVDTMLRRDGAWHWADGTSPVAKLTADDTIRYQDAFGEVEDWRRVDPDGVQGATDQAKTFVLFDHQRPLIDGNVATVPQKERLAILGQFEKMITHTILNSGDDAGRQLSRQLGETYGTLRPGLSDLPGPSVTVPAADGSLSGIGRGSVDSVPESVPSPGGSAAGDSAGHVPSSSVHYPSDVQHLFGEIDDMLQDMGLFRNSLDDLPSGPPSPVHPGTGGGDVHVGTGGDDVVRFMDDTRPVRQHLEHAIADPAADIRLVVGTDGTTGARSLTVWLPGRDAPVPLGPGAPGELGVVRGTVDGAPAGGTHILDEHRITAAQLENAYLYAARNLPLWHTDAGRFTDEFMDAVLDARPAAPESSVGTTVHDVPDTPSAVGDMGKGKSATGSGSHHDGVRGNAGDLSEIDASAAITDARRELINARTIRDDLQTRYVDGVGTSAEVDGVRYLESWQQVRQADAALAQAEAHWNDLTGGAPLPEVQSYTGHGLGGGAPRLPDGLRSLLHLKGRGDAVPPAPEGIVQSVDHVPAATHVVTPLEGGKFSHALVPSGQDLTVAHWLSEPQSAHGWPKGQGREAYEGDLHAHQEILTEGLARAEHDDALKSVLLQQQKSFDENTRLFQALEGRTELRDLRMPQLAAIVMAERRALRTLAADTDLLTMKLRSGEWDWAKGYRLDGADAGELITKVHKHLQDELSLTVNLKLGNQLQGGGTLLDAMTADQQLLRNAWEIDNAGAGYYVTRGNTEEALGLPASVKRTTDASGIYPGQGGKAFAPTAADLADLPNYAALTSKYRPSGVKMYGQAVFHLKPNLMERATFTPADSFGQGLEGALSVTGRGNMLPLLNHGPEVLVRLAFAEATDFQYDSAFRGLRDAGKLEGKLNRYFEAQLHGGVKWDDLDRVVLVNDGFNPAGLQAQKLQLEQFAKDKGLSFTVEVHNARPGAAASASGVHPAPPAPPGSGGAHPGGTGGPGPSPAHAPGPASGHPGDPGTPPAPGGSKSGGAADEVHDNYEDLRFTASLLDESGAPRADLMDEAARIADTRHVLSREDELFHTVNLNLRKLGQENVTRAEFDDAFRTLQGYHGGVLPRMTTRALAEDVTAVALGETPPRLRAGMAPASVGDDAAGSSSAPAPAALPTIDGRTVVGITGHDGMVVQVKDGTPQVLGAGSHHFDVVDVQRGGAVFTVRHLGDRGVDVHRWTYRRMGRLQVVEETMTLSGGHFGDARITFKGADVLDVSVDGATWPAKVSRNGEVIVASPVGNQVYDRVTGALIRSDAPARTPLAVPTSVPPAQGDSWRAAVHLAQTHLGRAASDNEIKLFMQGVIGGAFTSKKGYGGYVNPVLAADADFLRKVEQFNKVTRDLLHEGANEPMTVWRGVSMDPHAAQSMEFIERLPASTSNNRAFQAEWAKNGVSSNRVVFEIHVPADHGKLAMAYPPGYGRAGDDALALNQDQWEVTLSPTKLVRTGPSRIEDGITVIPVKAEQIAASDLKGLIGQKWEGLDSVTAFGDFGRAFEQGAVRRWEGLEDAVVRQTGTDPSEKTFEISRPGRAGELKVKITHHSQDNAVSVKITGGESEFSGTWSGTGFSNLAADLRGTVLHNNDLFNPLPTPSSWSATPQPAPVRAKPSHEAALVHTQSTDVDHAPAPHLDTATAEGVAPRAPAAADSRSTAGALPDDATVPPLGHELPQLRDGTHSAPAAHPPVDFKRLNDALAVHADATSNLRQAENRLIQTPDESPNLPEAEAKVTAAVDGERRATVALDSAVDDLIGSRNLTQVELNSLVDRLAGSSYVDQALRLRAHSDELDRLARTPAGAGRPDQVLWTGAEIRAQADEVRLQVAGLEHALEPGSTMNQGEIRQLIGELRDAAGSLRARTDGFIKDASDLGGAYALRAESRALVVAVDHFVKLADEAVAAVGPGQAVSLARPFLVDKAVRGLSGGVFDTVRRYRVWGAYKDVPTGHQWGKVLPDPEGKWASAIGDFPNNLTPKQQGEFVKNLSRRNVQVLSEEFDALLGRLDADDARALRELRDHVRNLPQRIKHATPAYLTMANSGFMMSQGELERRGLKFLASGKSSVNNTSNLGNDDFVFFRMEAGDAPMQTRYGPTTLIFDAKALEERGGWVSLHDQLNPLDRPTMRNLEWNKSSIRTAAFDDGFVKTGERARWTYTYPDKSSRTVSFEQEVFHGADVKDGLALSVVREVHSIGGDYKAHVLKVMGNPDELGKVVSDLFRPEAKFGGNLPFTPLGANVAAGRWTGLVDVHNPMGDGRYLPDGTVDPIARAAGKQHDEALDRLRQAQTGMDGGHTKHIKFNLRKAEAHAQQSVELTDRFRRTATGDRVVMAERLYDERAKLLADIRDQMSAVREPSAHQPVGDHQKPGNKPAEDQQNPVPSARKKPAVPKPKPVSSTQSAPFVLPPELDRAISGALGDATPDMRQVIAKLVENGGSISFDQFNGSSIQKAFGIGRNRVDAAVKAMPSHAYQHAGAKVIGLGDDARTLFMPQKPVPDLPSSFSAPGAAPEAPVPGAGGSGLPQVPAPTGGDMWRGPGAGRLDPALDARWDAARDGAVPQTVKTSWVDPVSTPRGGGAHAPRYKVTAGFDVRRFEAGGRQVTDLTVNIRLEGKGLSTAELEAVWERALSGVEKVFNRPGAVMPDGSVLHVTLKQVANGADAHLNVRVGGPDGAMNQHQWRVDATEQDLAHELGHQLGLRDEYRDTTAGHRPEIDGSLMGNYHNAAPEGLSQGGLRGRYLDLIHTQVVSHDHAHLPHLGAATDDVIAPPAPGTGKGRADADAVSVHEGPDLTSRVDDPLSPAHAETAVQDARHDLSRAHAELRRLEALDLVGTGSSNRTVLDTARDRVAAAEIRLAEAEAAELRVAVAEHASPAVVPPVPHADDASSGTGPVPSLRDPDSASGTGTYPASRGYASESTEPHPLRVDEADGTFTRYDGHGAPFATGRPLPALPGVPDGLNLVTPTQGAAWLEDATGTRIAHFRGQEVTATPDGLRVTHVHTGGPRDGEFIQLGVDGTLVKQGFNVLDKGRTTPYQYVLDHRSGTWARTGGPDGAPRGVFHHGKADLTGAANGRVVLLSATGAPVPVFERRVLPGGGLLDSFRRTDSIAFGRTNPRTSWARWGDEATLSGAGIREYDTAGTGWRDLDGRGNVVHEYQTGLQKHGNGTGHTLALRNGNGELRWHRFDGAGEELAAGPRIADRHDSGWTDLADDGRTLVQRKWGMGRLPEHAGQYEEHKLVQDAGAPGGWRTDGTWQRQSPHGKEVGKAEVVDGHLLVTERWREQRPPVWVRNGLLPGAGRAEGAYAHVLGDNAHQLFTWEKRPIGTATGEGTSGVRYVALDGGILDLTANGDFARLTTKLHDGTTLKVGDHAHGPGYPAAEASYVPWEDSGGRHGYRVPQQGSSDGVLWQDRFQGPDGRLRVAREGLPGGVVREYADAPVVGHPSARGTWVTRDAHGNLTGIRHPNPDGTANSFIEGVGRADSAKWTWREVNAEGAPLGPSGTREFFRGSNDPRLSWDDSFRDLDADRGLVRERRMLDDGRYVDAWRDRAAGGRWLTSKHERNGNPVDPGPGQQVRTWWNGTAWQDQWTRGARHFRDELRPPPGAGGATVRLRQVPVGAGGPQRVREYDPAAATPHSVWKEFDHGSVVRERRAEGTGYLETDAWRGQWNRYDADGGLVAQRTDSGLVWERGSLGQMRLVGNEYDYRGALTEIRGWGRRIREAQRMPWSGTVVPDGAGAALREARYEPYWRTVAYKAAVEFGQEFVLEFGANLIVNGIVAAAQNKPFTGQDALKAFANAAVSSGVKTGLGIAAHENRIPWFRNSGNLKATLANIDGGKHPQRRPFNHDKTWTNEWAGNETPTRWRGGIYDFTFSAGTSVISAWVNGAMNAAAWGVTAADGTTVKLTGAEAFLDGGINATAALTTAASTALVKNVVVLGGGSRLFHRQGFADFWIQLPFKIFEKSIQSVYLTGTYRASINPSWYQVPPAGTQQKQ
ncbi:hypothetical protein ABZ461_31655 [Actinacidiphila glaucinigra]|uniref:hypothetical protein n=1 Tax=Actinacidiphila glaucinigra TaxID=235986 RepID=UPI0033C246C0